MRFICNKIIIKFLLLFILLIGRVEAQTLDSVRVVYKENDLPRAKQLIDEFVVDSPAIAAGWLLKAKIYRALNDNIRYRDLTADANGEAFTALKKVSVLQPDLLKGDSTALYIYRSYTDNGVAFFNAGTEKQSKADYTRALKSFKKAAEVWSYIYQNKWGKLTDTTNLLYSAKAAIYSEDEPEAFYFSKRIVDDSIPGADFERVYQWLLYYYRKQKDESNLERYSEQYGKLFPNSAFWILNYIDFINEQDNYDYVNIFAFYEKLFAKKGFDIPEYRYAYIKDLFSYLYKKEEFDGTDKGGVRDLLEASLTSYIRTNPNDAKAKLLFGKFYINKAVDLTKQQSWVNISNLLLKSNKYLKDLADRSPKANKNLKIEAVKLLIGNYEALKQPTHVKRYNSLYKKLLSQGYP